MALTVWTIGHSTHPLGEFIGILREHAIEVVADVRRFPASRRQPHFAASALDSSLGEAGVAYLPLPSLGGRRVAAPDTPNTGWRHAAFRGYADHLSSDEFAEGLTELLMTAHGLRTAVMCSEALWWRCHRRLIADVLLVMGAHVVHIMGRSTVQDHRLTAPAHIDEGRLSYSAVSSGSTGR